MTVPTLLSELTAPPIRRRSALGMGAGLCVAGAVTMARAPAAAAEDLIVLADAAGAKATWILPTGADPKLNTASADVIALVKQATGQTMVRTTNAAVAGLKIYLDRAARTARPDLPTDLAPSEYVLEVTTAGIFIVGGTPQASTFGMYKLLELADFRWIMPGANGVDLPRAGAVVAVAPLARKRFTPFFPNRMLQNVDTYPSSAFVPGQDRAEGAVWTTRVGLDNVSLGAHGYAMLPAATKATNPELFMKVDGVVTNQVDVTHPEVLTRVVSYWRDQLTKNPALPYINMGPADGGGFGETSWDVPGRIDPLNGELIVTDRLVKFFNAVLDALPEYPNVKLAFYAYHLYLEPPVREQPNPRLLPLIAPIAVARRVSMQDANGWERRYVKRVIQGWQALGVGCGYRAYIGPLSDATGAFSAARQLAHEIPALAAAGVTGPMRLESLQGWGYAAPSYYLCSQLFWDPTVNSDAVLDEYYARAYGSGGCVHAQLLHHARGGRQRGHVHGGRDLGQPPPPHPRPALHPGGTPRCG